MDYTVSLTIEATDPLTEDVLFDIAAIGGAASGFPGEHTYTTTLTVDAPTLDQAPAAALGQILPICPGEPTAIEAMTTTEHDRRLEAPAFPELVGITEIADILGVTRQRASALQNRAGFPAPIARLRSGPIWRKGDLSRFQETWDRKSGRPSKTSSQFDARAVKYDDLKPHTRTVTRRSTSGQTATT